MGIFKPRYASCNMASHSTRYTVAKYYHIMTNSARRLLRWASLKFIQNQCDKQAQLICTCYCEDGTAYPIDKHAYKLAFVHEELDSVHRMRRRMQQYGRPELPQHTFRVRPPSLTKEKLEQVMAEMNNGSYSVGEAPWIQNCNGLPDARTSI